MPWLAHQTFFELVNLCCGENQETPIRRKARALVVGFEGIWVVTAAGVLFHCYMSLVMGSELL